MVSQLRIKTDDATQHGLHVFERAGLGKAPFRFVNFSVRKYQACQGAPVQPGASCDFCGTGIMQCCEILSADGKRFLVGVDCVQRTGDAGLLRGYSTSPEVRKMNRLRREAKDEANKAEWARIMADPAAREKLAAYHIGEGVDRTDFLSFAERAWGWCGMSGRARYVRSATKILAGKQLGAKG